MRKQSREKAIGPKNLQQLMTAFLAGAAVPDIQMHTASRCLLLVIIKPISHALIKCNEKEC